MNGNSIKRISPKEAFTKRGLLSLALLLSMQLFIYLVPTALTPLLTLHDITLPIDARIPFLPAFIIPYLLVFIEWGYCYMLAPALGTGRFGRFAAACAIGFAVTFATYLAFPTTYIRPRITDDGFFPLLVKAIYGVDEPSRCLPSLHCFLAWIDWRLVSFDKRVPVWLRGVTFFLMLLILPVTLLVKQHVFVDVPAGVLVAELSWQLAALSKLDAKCAALYERIWARLAKHSDKS